jgi:hypothetical protein
MGLALDFLLRVYLRTPALGKGPTSAGLRRLMSRVLYLNRVWKINAWVWDCDIKYFSFRFIILTWTISRDRRQEILTSKHVWIKRPYSCHCKLCLDILLFECIWQLLTHYEWDVVDYPSFSRTASGPRVRGAVYKFPIMSTNWPV